MARELMPELIDECEEFLGAYYHEDILDLANKYPREQKSLFVDWMDLFRFNPELADDYLNMPEFVLGHLEKALAEYDLPVDIDLSSANVRFENLDDGQTRHIGEYRPEEINKKVGVKGQVKLLSEPKVDVETAAFECTLCGTMHYVDQTDAVGELQDPHECSGCERKGPYQLIKSESEFVQHQLARLDRPPEHSKGDGADIDVVIRGDLAGTCLEGNERVIANGILTIDDHNNDGPPYPYHLETTGGGFEIEDGGYDTVDIDEHKERILEIADSEDPIGMLVDSLAPQLSPDDELEQIMTAIVLQLVSAGRKDIDGGATYRGDFHILILSDPGMGKSELLNEVQEISPVGRFASGKGLSKAGVTAAAVRESDFAGDQWVLKAGLLVLANDGIACLDEIDKVNPEAISSMHSALEKQRVDVVKAGIDSSLPARCSLLAAGNPKYGRFDPYEPISDQIELEPSLMSRFDLMFMMSDQPDAERDREIAEHVVESWVDAGRQVYRGEETGNRTEPPVSKEVFRAYVAYAREQVRPVFEDRSLADELIEHYVNVRSKGVDEDSPVPVTARKLQAFMRLAEASARARLSETIEEEDVQRAINLVMKSLNDVGVDPETGEMDADIVEAGTSKAQRDRIKSVKAIIRSLEGEYSEGAPIDEVAEYAMDMDISESKVEHEIEKLKQKGEVYEPSTDHLRTTE